jgi:cell division septation protein DedD
MIQSQTCEVPIMFLDIQEVQKELENAYGYAYKLNSVFDPSQIVNTIGMSNHLVEGEEDISLAIGRYTLACENNSSACIIQFPDQGSVLLIVGNQNNHYLIDPSNGVFCASNGPEYDIESYVKLYGNKEDYLVYFYQEEEEREKEEKKRVEPPTASVELKNPAPVKKPKKKPTSIPLPPPPSPANEPVSIENK